MNKKWLDTCVTVGEFLYGEYPVTVLQKLYATKGEKISTEEIKEFLSCGSMMVLDGEMIRPLIVTDGEMLKLLKEADRNGNPYASLHFDPEELMALRKEQARPGLDYWFPTASQIEELMENGYLRSPQYDALEKAVVSHKGNPAVLPGIWAEASSGKIDVMEVVQAIIDRTEMDFERKNDDDMGDLNDVLNFVMAFMNRINYRDRKGWTSEELSQKTYPKGVPSRPIFVPGSVHATEMMKEAEPMLRSMGATVDYSSIDSFATVGPHGERRVVKVGRNDPCPCGSGKKYKRCHGR